MAHKEHRRARLLPTGNDPSEGAWLAADPDPRIPLKIPIHYWSTWKGLARRDWLFRDTRLIGVADQTTRDWAVVFARVLADEFREYTDDEFRRVVQETELWSTLEDRMINGGDKYAFEVATGAAREMHRALESWSAKLLPKAEDAFEQKMWSPYRVHFQNPMNPSHKVFYP